ncbi:thioredoxin family protein [Nocardia ignorata]|uniref:thioredoxin family protein n=1 Tax=Nocardia ignorata TaxID=145285 RepID=UPI0036345DF6
MIETIADATTFRQIVQRRDPLFAVLFHGGRDPNSHKIRQVFEQFAGTEGRSISCATMEYDDWSRVVEDYRITALPTILIFTDGELRDRIVGTRTHRELVTYFAEYMSVAFGSSVVTGSRLDV